MNRYKPIRPLQGISLGWGDRFRGSPLRSFFTRLLHFAEGLTLTPRVSLSGKGVQLKGLSLRVSSAGHRDLLGRETGESVNRVNTLERKALSIG